MSSARGARELGLAALTALSIAGACKGPADRNTSATSTVVTGEDGVRRVRHGGGVLTNAPTYVLVDTPDVVAGDRDGDSTFEMANVMYASLMSDGSIVALDQFGPKIYVFAADGRGERMIGRRGRGPGEFLTASNPIMIAKDTLLIMDLNSRRLNWITPHSNAVRSASIQEGPPGFWYKVAGMLSADRLVLHSAGTTPGCHERQALRSTACVGFLLLSGGAQEIARIPDVLQDSVETRYGGKRRIELMRVELAAHAFVTVWDTAIVTSAVDGYRLQMRNSGGAVVEELIVDAPRRAVTNAIRERFVSERLSMLHAPNWEQPIDLAESERLVRETHFADSLPLIGGLFVSPDKTLWVLDPIVPGDTSWSATAFALDGSIQRRLLARGVTRPMAFGNDRVLLMLEDEDGRVTLRVHRFEPAGGTGKH